MKPFLNKSSTFLRNVRFHWKNYLKLYLSPKHKGYFKKVLDKFLNILHFRRQTAFFAVLGAVFVLTIALFPGFARADVWTSGTQAILGFIFELLFAFLGPLLSAIIASLVDVAKYNNIIGQTTIKTAWTTVRDIVNMFFIFAILLIAFSTILRIRQYEAKQLLPKLVLYAVLVNFSLTICGIFIDIAQIFTLTFVSAFQDSAVNNFANITKMMDYASVQLDGPVGVRDILAGYILGTALLVISIVVIGALVLVLLARILFLWVLAILSPFVFVLPIIPGGQKYSSQWWSMFSSYVISGPLLAFFIWLSLTVMSQQKIGSEIISTGSVKIVKTTMGEPTFLLDYVMGMGMLIVGLILTQKLGGVMGSVAGGVVNKMRGTAMGAANWTRRRIGVSGAIGGAAAVMTGGASLGVGIAAGMATRGLTRFGLRTETGQRAVGVARRGLETTARVMANIPILRPTLGRLAVGLRGAMRHRELQQEKEIEQYLKRRSPAELTQIARDRSRPHYIQEAAMDRAPWAARTPADVQRMIAGYDRSQLRDLKRGDFERITRSHPTITRAHLEGWVRGNQYFGDLSNNEREALVNPAGGPNPGRIHTRPVDPVTGANLTDTQLFGQRWFGEIKDSTEESPNDIISGDMVVKANQVNLTGEKAGSTLGKDLGDPGKTSGVDSLLRRGLKDGVGRLAIDFNRLGLTGAGANLVGEGKAQMIPKLLEQLRKEGRTPAELQSIEKELQKAKSLSLINKTRDKGDARKIISHEAIHDVLDDGVSVEERREMWGKMDPQKQAETEKKIRANWAGGDKMSQDQVIEEYLANGLTNETRWGDKSENALKLDKSVQDELRKKGVFEKMNEGLVHRMSEKEIKTPDTLKTEEEFRKHNEQVAAQASGQAIHQTLTGKAQEESGEEVIEITGEGELEKREEKEEEEEDKKEEKTAQTYAGHQRQDVRAIPEIRSVIREIGEAGKGEMDTRFFSRIFDRFNAIVGQGIAGIGKTQTEQMGKLSKTIKGLQETAAHAKSDNPLIRESAKEEYNIKLEEFKNEYYNALGEDPASEDEIKDAIGDLK